MTRRALRAGSAALALVSLAFVARCTLVTHAQDFRTAPDTRACAACPTRPDLLHPPCAAKGAPDGDGARRIYALRSVDLGADRAAWNLAYWVGRDQDCSDRPGGLPVECAASQLVMGGAWVALPRGVDNALAAQTLAPLAGDARLPPAARDLQGSINADLAAGGWGMILAVDGWNGLADDASVTVTLEAARGISDPSASCGTRPRTPPKWDGADAWDVYPFSLVSGGTAYVVGGQLVWDARSVNGASVHLENDGGVLDARLLDMVLVGAIAPDKISHLALSGRWSTATAHLTIGFLSGQDQAVACALHAAYPAITFGLPFDTPGPIATDLAASPGDVVDAPAQCGAASIGLGLEMERAASTADSPCAIPVPQAMPATCADAGP